MATTKTLTPTNQAITLAAFTEKPDNRTNVTNDDKMADAINTLNSNMTNVINDSVTSANSNVLINMQRTLIIGKLVTYNLVLEISAQLARNTDVLTGLQIHNGGFNGVPTVVATNNEGGFTHFSVADGGKLISAETIPTGRWRMAFSYII